MVGGLLVAPAPHPSCYRERKNGGERRVRGVRCKSRPTEVSIERIGRECAATPRASVLKIAMKEDPWRSVHYVAIETARPASSFTFSSEWGITGYDGYDFLVRGETRGNVAQRH